MRYFKVSLALCLVVSMTACKRADPIRLQPTIEEPEKASSVVRIGDVATSSQLVSGFYEAQESTWCWTAPKFVVAIATPPGASKNGAWVILNFSLPDTSLNVLKTITVNAKVGDVALEPEAFTTSGEHTYRHEAPASAFLGDSVRVTFTVDKFLKPSNDNRELALVVTAIGLESK